MVWDDCGLLQWYISKPEMLPDSWTRAPYWGTGWDCRHVLLQCAFACHGYVCTTLPRDRLPRMAASLSVTTFRCQSHHRVHQTWSQTHKRNQYHYQKTPNTISDRFIARPNPFMLHTAPWSSFRLYVNTTCHIQMSCHIKKSYCMLYCSVQPKHCMQVNAYFAYSCC